jgi:hypothetical protein
MSSPDFAEDGAAQALSPCAKGKECKKPSPTAMRPPPQSSRRSHPLRRAKFNPLIVNFTLTAPFHSTRHSNAAQKGVG